MSQVEKLYSFLQDGRPHRVDDILREVYGSHEGFSIARLGARIFDLKRKHNVEIKSFPDPVNKKLWWYQIVKEGAAPVKSKLLSLDRKSEIAKGLVWPRPEIKKEVDLFN